MKIILLPGLDGTGELFSDLLSYFEADVSVVPLPLEGGQDFETLTEYVMGELPDEEYVLVAESFSGPIGARIAKLRPDCLRGIVFVATFLTSPSALLLSMAKLLPLKKLSRMPFSSVPIRGLLFGWRVGADTVERFNRVLAGVPGAVIEQRVDAISHLSTPMPGLQIPALYIRASNDRLVSADMWREFASVFGDFSVVEIDGPHMILQRQPEQCSLIIKRFVEKCASHPA